MIDGVLVVHRVSRHTAINCLSFLLLHNRHLILTIGIRYDLELEEVDDKPYDLDVFQGVLNTALSMKRLLTRVLMSEIFKPNNRGYKRHHQSVYSQ